MAARKLKAGTTGHVDTVFLRDTSVTTAVAGLAGLVYNSAGLTCYYKRSSGSAAVPVTLQTITTLGTFQAGGGGFKAVDGTNAPGLYEFQPPDAALAAGAKGVDFFFRGATDMEDVVLSYELDAIDYQDAQRAGLNGLPAAGTLAVNPVLDPSQSFDNAGQTTALPAADPSGVTTLLARLTAARAGYLDALNTGGAVVATQADVNALNQSASRRVILVTVGQYERPESGTSSYTVEARTYDPDGAAVNADATPTLVATGIASGDLSANLSAATNPATGVYRWTYTVDEFATPEQLRFDLSATIGGQAFGMAVYTLVADFVAATWTTADRSTLETLAAAYVPPDNTAIGAAVFAAEDAATKALAAQTAAESADGKLTAPRLGKLDSLTFTTANRIDATAVTVSDKTGYTASVAAGGIAATALAADALTAIADAILKRDFSAVTGESARSLLNAARFLRNKWSVSGSTLTVTKEDDSTPAWTATVSTNAAAEPVVGSDPA